MRMWSVVMVAACSGGPSAPPDTVPFETCMYTLDAWCAAAPPGAMMGCPMTWADAQDRMHWQCPEHLKLYDCGRNHVALQPFLETRTEFEYGADGLLYRVDSHSINGVQPMPCAGGAGPRLDVTDKCTLVADLSGCP